MPIVKRAEYDMLRLTPVTDILVNPVNCMGVMGAGLAKAFSSKWPEMYEDYREVCREGRLQPGELHVYHDKKSGRTIINLPTKRHWVDTSRIDDIELGCLKLAAYLKDKPFHSVAMPILGSGLGRLDYSEILPVLHRIFDPLPNIIQLSMRPDRLEKPLRYFVVVGSRAYTDIDRVDLGVKECLLDWNLSVNDFEGMVSGGAPGVDAIACGRRMKDNAPTVAKRNGFRRIVCEADWDRFQNSAGFIRNRLVADIGTHFLFFIGRRSAGTRDTHGLVLKWNEMVDRVTKERATDPYLDDPFYRTMPDPLPEKKVFSVVDISAYSE